MSSLGEREEAFRRIYEAHYRHISAYARRRVSGGDAEDIVAETFLVAWRRMDAIPPGELTLPWLYGVARRVVSQRQRSGRRRGRLLARLGGLRDDDPATMVDPERMDEQALVRSALTLLREADQEILRLSEWEELTASELAVTLDCSTNAVAIRLHRARRRLAKALEAAERDARTPLPDEERYA
jgi:RNA polymerase sigma factor (sigma-70 family)